MAVDYNFDDITPVKINEEEPQLCRILYDDEYKSTMGILLALLTKKEYSERALYLTEKGIGLLASHYTIWNYRYNILIELKKDLFEELDWCEQIALENEKNYQIWNYRQLIIKRILANTAIKSKFNPHREYPILNAMLELDTKNHHVWSYRKWLVETFDLYFDEKETLFVDKLIECDLRNNSAWTHRFFIKFSSENMVTESLIESEINYTKQSIEKSPQNPSTWNYLIGIYRKFNKDLVELEDFCLNFANINNVGVDNEEEIEYIIKSSFALEILAEIYEKLNNFNTSIRIYDLLSLKYDPIRLNYWNYKKSKILKPARS